MVVPANRYYQYGLGKTLRAINLFPDMVEHGRDSDIVRGLVKTVLFAVSLLVLATTLYTAAIEQPLPDVRITWEGDAKLLRPTEVDYLALKAKVANASDLVGLTCPCRNTQIVTNATQQAAAMGNNHSYYELDEQCADGFVDFAIVKRFPAAYASHLRRGDPAFYANFEARYNGSTPWSRADFISDAEFKRRTITEKRRLGTRHLCRAVTNLIHSNAEAYLRRVLTSPTLMEEDIIVAMLGSRFQHMVDLSVATFNMAYEKDTFRLEFEGLESEWGRGLNHYLDAVHGEDVAAMAEAYEGFMHKMLTGTEPAFTKLLAELRAAPVVSLTMNSATVVAAPAAAVPTTAAACLQPPKCLPPGGNTTCAWMRYLFRECTEFKACNSSEAAAAKTECLNAGCESLNDCAISAGNQKAVPIAAIAATLPFVGFTAQKLSSDRNLQMSLRIGVANSISVEKEKVSIVKIGGKAAESASSARRLTSSDDGHQRRLASAAAPSVDVEFKIDIEEVAVLEEMEERVLEQVVAMPSFIREAAAERGVLSMELMAMVIDTAKGSFALKQAVRIEIKNVSATVVNPVVPVITKRVPLFNFTAFNFIDRMTRSREGCWRQDDVAVFRPTCGAYIEGGDPTRTVHGQAELPVVLRGEEHRKLLAHREQSAELHLRAVLHGAR